MAHMVLSLGKVYNLEVILNAELFKCKQDSLSTSRGDYSENGRRHDGKGMRCVLANECHD